MPAVYVLDVPEFRAMVDVARRTPGYRVIDVGLSYYRVEADDELVFNRRELGFKPAVWYGAFTGGLDGRIAEFGRDTVRLVESAEA